MSRAVVVSLAAALLQSTGCQKPSEDPASSGSKQAPSKDLASALLGEYVESWAPNGAGQTQHSFSKQQWSEEHQDTTIQLALVSQRSLGSNQWAAAFEYALPSSQERQFLRVDFLKTDANTLWICRHPKAQGPDLIEADAADATDKSGRGCFGAPWRELKAVDNPASALLNH